MEEHDDHLDQQLFKMVDIIENTTVKEIPDPKADDRSSTVCDDNQVSTGINFIPKYSKKANSLGRKRNLSFKEGAMLQKDPCLELEIYEGSILENGFSYDSCQDSALGSEPETPHTLRRVSSTATTSNQSSDSVSTGSNVDYFHEEAYSGNHVPLSGILLNCRSRSLSASMMTKQLSAITRVRRTSITSELQCPVDFKEHKVMKSAKSKLRSNEKHARSDRHHFPSVQDEQVLSPVIKIKEAWTDEESNASEAYLRPGFMF